MRKTIRRAATIVLAALIGIILYGVFGEFFIELARERGWYDNPTQRMVRIMTGARDIATSPQLITTVAVMAGFVGGLWLDWGLRRGERREPSDAARELARQLDDLFAEGVAHRNRLIPTIDSYVESAASYEREQLDIWQEKVLELLNNELVTVKEQSNFRTFDMFQPIFTQQEGKTPQQNKLEALWREKLNRLRHIINRIGG